MKVGQIQSANIWCNGSSGYMCVFLKLCLAPSEDFPTACSLFYSFTDHNSSFFVSVYFPSCSLVHGVPSVPLSIISTFLSLSFLTCFLLLPVFCCPSPATVAGEVAGGDSEPEGHGFVTGKENLWPGEQAFPVHQRHWLTHCHILWLGSMLWN